jgi:ankyrin repeat protein
VPNYIKLAKLKDINRPVGGKGLNSLTPLHWLASRGLVPEARTLVQRGAKIDAELPMMARPIGFAIENNQPLMIHCLLELGADADYAFHYAVESNRPALAEMVYAHAVELEKKGTMDRTAAHSAALSGADRSLALLARLGANLEARDEKGDTPLHYAAMFGELRAVQRLLELKVDVNPVDSEGKTPLDFAIEDDYRSVAGALKAKGGKTRHG